jgi:hypothetical protein
VIHAQTNGLLDKQTVYTDNGISTVNVTDGSTTTGYMLQRTAPGNSLVIDLPKIASVTSFFYSVSASPQRVFIRFYDDMNILLHEEIALNGSSGYTINRAMSNLKKIIIINTDPNYRPTINEFDIFGQYSYRIPTNLVGDSLPNKVHLTWDNIVDQDLLGFNVYQNGTKLNSSLVTTTNYDVLAQPDIPNDYYVTAVYSTSTTPYETAASNTISVFAQSSLFNDPVLDGTAYTDRIELTFLGIGTPVTYDLFDGNGNLLEANTSPGLHIFNGLQTNAIYTYYVVATDKYGRTYNSNVLMLMTKVPPSPVLPDIKLQSVSHDSLSIYWANLGAPYTLTKDGQVVTSTLNTYVWSENKTLNPDTEYEFIVAYTDTYGRYIESLPFKVRTLSIPAVKVPVLTYQGLMHDYVKLVWNNTGGEYEVFQDGQSIGKTSSILKSVTNLTPSTDYEFYVQSTDIYGRVSKSNVVKLTTLSAPAPKPPPSPPTPPPAVSNSGNPALNQANDYLVQGAKDTKKASMDMMSIIMLIFIMVFGIWWIIRLYKKKMVGAIGSKTTVSSSYNQPQSQQVVKPLNMSLSSVKSQQSGTGNKTLNMSLSNVQNQNKRTAYGGSKSGRKKYHVEKTFHKKRKR